MQRLSEREIAGITQGRDHAGRALLPTPLSVSEGPSRASLSPILLHVLQEIQRELSAQKDVVQKPEQILVQVCERLGFTLSSVERDEVLSYIERDEKPFGILQQLVDDPQVSDIIVTDHAKIAVQQGRRNYVTSLRFPSAELYEAFVEKLLQRAGSTYSTKKPIADGMLGSFARVHVVHKSLCESGPYLTIRLNRFSSVGIEDLIQCGLAPREIFHYLQGMVQSGRTVLVVGEVGTGKTTLVRALASAVPHEESLLVIEDTPEIRLAHPHVRYMTTREANSDGAGKVSPSECIRAGMRMAMNRIIFGEIRDAEAAESFIDVCASGHPGVSTIHGRSAAEAVARLELFLGRAQKSAQKTVFTEQIATAVHLIVHVDICKVTGRRRIMDVREIGPVADGALRQREMFKYALQDSLPAWKVCSKLSAHREALESLSQPVVLSQLPNLIELNPEHMMRELTRARAV
jgi:pilus assembly protein CpaF